MGLAGTCCVGKVACETDQCSLGDGATILRNAGKYFPIHTALKFWNFRIFTVTAVRPSDQAFYCLLFISHITIHIGHVKRSLKGSPVDRPLKHEAVQCNRYIRPGMRSYLN